VNKERPTRRIGHKEVIHNRWLNVYPFIPGSLAQWKNDMRCDVIYAASKISGIKPMNPLIDVYDLGGTRGIKDIMPEFMMLPQRGQDMLQNLFQFRYMHDVCDVLYGIGYKDRSNLYGIPYDFRLVLDKDAREALFTQFREFIMKSVATNGGKKCVVFAHSLGCIMFKWFLSGSGMVTEQWIADYIEEIVMVSPPFGGSLLALKTIMFGDFYVPKFHKLYRDELQINTGIVICLPNEIGFNPTAELMNIGGRSISIESSYKYCNDHISFQIWRDLYKPFQDVILQPLDVKVTVFVGNKAPTPIWYRSLHEEAYPTDERTVGGDGIIVPICTSVYTKMFGDRVDIRDVDSKHIDIISNSEVLAKLLEVALAPP
jgi:hypothetical protein